MGAVSFFVCFFFLFFQFTLLSADDTYAVDVSFPSVFGMTTCTLNGDVSFKTHLSHIRARGGITQI